MRAIGKRGEAARKELAAVRALVIGRAAGKCERCGESERAVGRLHVHHKRGRAQGGTHEPSNLAALCSAPNGGCHRAIHDHTAKDWRRWIETRKRA